MEQRTILPLLIFFLVVPRTAAATRPPQSTQTELTATPQGTPEGAVSKHPDDSDTLLVPDGTPLLIKAVDEFSSLDAKVGDVIHFVVVFTVRADGIAVIPKGTALNAKVVSVSRPRLGSRGGHVKVAYDRFSLPTGEAASVRNPQHKATDSAEAAAMAPGLAGMVLSTGGVGLLTLLANGNDQFVPAGATEVVSLSGSLRVSRKAAMLLQPASSSGYVYIDPRIRVRPLWCGQRILYTYNSSIDFLQLELNPGTYWFSTGRQKDQLAKIEVVGNREYYIVQDRHGLSVRETKASKDFFVSGLVLDEWDLTKETAEESRLLVAQPIGKQNYSPAQKH
jgi:hypothetical protein